MDLDEFVAAAVKESGKKVYTLADVAALTEQWIQYKKAAAVPFEGWRSDEEIDVLLFGAPLDEVTR